MKTLETQVYRGANYWAPVPVIRFVLEISELEARPTDLIEGFFEKLTSALPTLRKHRCSTGQTGAFLERVRAGSGLGHVAQHTALEIQNMAGQRVSGCYSCLSADQDCELGAGTHQFIFRYEQPDVGVAAGKFAIRLLESFLSPQSDSEFDFAREQKELFDLARALSYGPSTRALVREAQRRDIPVQRLDESRERVQLGRGTRALRSLLQLGYGKYQKRIWAPYISTESHLAADIALNKDLTNRLIRTAGLPVPQSIQVKGEEEAVVAARAIGYPVVLKPLDGNHGRGVGVNLRDEAAVRAHYPLARAETHTGTVLVETFLPGKTYRVLVVGGRAIAATEEVPAQVVGDGSHTLRQLVKFTNADPRRGRGSENLLVRISLDEAAINLAQQQGYGPNDIPPAGQRVQLVRTAHISLGGISIDRTNELHPYNALIAEQAAQVIGLSVAGIDLIAPDIARSVRETGGGICEVNAGPGLGLHAEPVEGKPRDVARPVIELLFPPGATSRIPIFAVSGSSGKTITSQMIAHILQTAGHRVGLANRDGIYLDGTPLVEGDMSVPGSVRIVLQNPAIDKAVFEIGYEGILSSGLGYDRADVAIITNVVEDHPPMQGINTIGDFARLNTVVATSTSERGVVVLNGDDEWCTWIAAKTQGRVIYFSMQPDNQVVKRQLDAHGCALLLRPTPNGEILSLLDEHETNILPVREIPAALNGCSRDNVANSLAAAGACIGLGVNLDAIRQGLRTFTSR